MHCYPFDTRAECAAALERLHFAMAEVTSSVSGMEISPPFYVIGRHPDGTSALLTETPAPIELADGRWGIPCFHHAFPTHRPDIEAKCQLPTREEIARAAPETPAP